MRFPPPTGFVRRPQSARRRAQAGFTIIEVTMATFVMAFGISTSIIAMQAAFKQIDLARGTTIASQVLQSEMERLRLMSWTSVAALPASATFNGATYFSSSARLGTNYQITRTVTDDSTNPGDIKDLTVTVRWNTSDGRSHQRSFNALYAKNGLYDYYYTVAHP